MKATEAKLLTFLKKSQQFEIPIYQRTYSWTKPECIQLFDDILRTGRGGEEISAHFIGSIVYIEKGLFQVMDQEPLLVIDGQQRLTTITLLIEALARNIDAEPIDGFSKEKLRNRYLIDPQEKDDRRYKLILTQTDEATLKAIIDQRPLPLESSIRVQQNFELLDQKIRQLEADDLEAFCLGMSKLTVVDISLNRDHDNPQLIFESMNSTGRELSQADLIRNYILMGLEPDEQRKLYTDYWRPMELLFGQEAYSKSFDGFMRHYLTFKTGEIPNIRRVYEHFKIYAKSIARIDLIVKDIYKFAKYYCAMALDQEADPKLTLAFADLRELKVDVAYPFLLELYDDYDQGLLSNNDLYTIIRIIEAYVFRRSVCQIPTNSLNKTFATFMRDIDKDIYLESIKAKFLQLSSYRRFPDDKTFKDDFMERNLYKFHNRSYWLRRFENHKKKERVIIDEYTIEHIMPQHLTDDWKSALGENWNQIHEKWLHTLGNLTLTAYNSEYSDRAFIEKRDMPEHGFTYSPLRVNKGLGQIKQWDESTIIERAKRLAKEALKIWSYPVLSDGAQNTTSDYFSIPSNNSDNYTIQSHPILLGNGTVPSLYKILRSEILKLDQCITEEFLERYISYKAETDFVDITPKPDHLVLTLNLNFYELQDPRSLARNIAGQDRWTKGDAEIELHSEENVNYVMGLVRQALEKQMG